MYDYNVLLKAYEFEGEPNHLPYRPHKEKGDSWGSIMLVCMRRGAKPAELPVVQAVKVELVLNLKTRALLASRKEGVMGTTPCPVWSCARKNRCPPLSTTQQSTHLCAGRFEIE